MSAPPYSLDMKVLVTEDEPKVARAVAPRDQVDDRVYGLDAGADEHVWDQHLPGDSNIVDVYVKRLRKKLDAPGRPTLIRTGQGAGHALERA